MKGLVVNSKQIRLVMPETLLLRVRKYDGGNQTRFILEAVEERLKRLEKAEFERELAEGYRMRNEERRRWAEEMLGASAECLLPAQ